MPKASSKPRRVLITRFSALGDVAMTIPVVYNACLSNPEVEFVYVTRPSMATMMLNPPANLTVRGVDVSGEYHGARGMLRMWRELYDEFHFDAYADLHNVIRTSLPALMSRLKGIPTVRLNKVRARRRALTRRRNKVMLPLTTQRARYREVFYRLGLNMEEHFTTLFPAGCAVTADSLLGDITLPEPPARLIGIAPFAKHPGKIYPLQQMERVVKELTEDPRNRIFLFGAAGEEAEVLEKWMKEYPNTMSFAGKRLGFPVELALLSRMDVMVSMDSANMHLASLVGVPVVAVWGATHPYCGFRGFRQSDATAVQMSMTCRPCSIYGNKPCHRHDYHCLAGIPPAAIIDRIGNILE